MAGKITVKRPVATERKWTICLDGKSIGHIIIHSENDWTGRVGTMNEAHFNAALELVSAEIAEEEILMDC